MSSIIVYGGAAQRVAGIIGQSIIRLGEGVQPCDACVYALREGSWKRYGVTETNGSADGPGWQRMPNRWRSVHCARARTARHWSPPHPFLFSDSGRVFALAVGDAQHRGSALSERTLRRGWLVGPMASLSPHSRLRYGRQTGGTSGRERRARVRNGRIRALHSR